MTQQINLYLAEFRPVRKYLSGRGVAQSALVLLLLLLAVVALNTARSYSVRGELLSAQAELTAQTSVTEQLQQSLAQRSSDTSLVQELSAREERLAESTEMLDFLRGSNLGNTTGFSEYMKDLSRASFEGMWLTEFSVLEGGQQIRLKGIAQKSAMVPDFIGRLASGRSPLRQQHFAKFLGNRINTAPLEGLEKQDLYQFELEAQN